MNRTTNAPATPSPPGSPLTQTVTATRSSSSTRSTTRAHNECSTSSKNQGATPSTFLSITCKQDFEKVKGKSVGGEPQFITSGFILPFAFYLFTFALPNLGVFLHVHFRATSSPTFARRRGSDRDFSLQLIEQFARFIGGVAIFRKVLRVGRQVEKRIEFFARIFFAIDCQIGLSKAQAIEHVVFAEAQVLFQNLDRAF